MAWRGPWWLALAGAVWLGPGCATSPEPKPEPEPEAPAKLIEDTKPDEVPPLPPAEAGPAEGAAAGETVAPPPDELTLSAETSRLLLASTESAEGDVAGALRLLEQAVQGNPKCFQCHYNRGALLERQGQLDQAIQAYRLALGIHPTHLASVINLSNLFLRQRKGSQAQTVVSAAVKAAPKDPGLRNQLAVVLLAQGKLDDAAEQAKWVLGQDERNSEAMLLLARSYYARGKNELAERILNKAQEIDKGNAALHNLQGFVYGAMDNPAAAMAAFKRAVELSPGLAEARNNLGVLYSRAHDYTSAAEQLRAAVAIDPYFVEAYLNLGNSLRGDKLFKEAEEAYRKVQELEPGNLPVLLNLGLMYLDDEVPDYEKSKRFGLSEEHLARFERAGGKHPRLAAYLDEARKKKERAVQTEERERKRKIEEEAKKKADEEARIKAEEEARRKAEEETRLKAEAEAKQKAEEEARLQAEEEAARKKAEAETAKQAAAEAAKQKKADEAAAKQAAAEAARQKKADEAAAKKAAAEAAKQKKADEAAAKKAGAEEARRKKAEEAAAKKKAAEEAKRKKTEGSGVGQKLGGGKDDEVEVEVPQEGGKLGDEDEEK